MLNVRQRALMWFSALTLLGLVITDRLARLFGFSTIGLIVLLMLAGLALHSAMRDK